MSLDTCSVLFYLLSWFIDYNMPLNNCHAWLEQLKSEKPLSSEVHNRSYCECPCLASHRTFFFFWQSKPWVTFTLHASFRNKTPEAPVNECTQNIRAVLHCDPAKRFQKAASACEWLSVGLCMNVCLCMCLTESSPACLCVYKCPWECEWDG